MMKDLFKQRVLKMFMSKSRWVVLTLIIIFVFSFCWTFFRHGRVELKSRLFPFYLPWDDSKETVAVRLSKQKEIEIIYVASFLIAAGSIFLRHRSRKG